MLKIHVSHRGDVVGRLQLPTPLEEIERQLEKLRQPGQILDIFDVDSPIPSLAWHLQYIDLDKDSALQKLEQLAEILEGMDKAGHHHLNKALDTQFQQSLDEVLQAAAYIKTSGMERYEVIPGVTTHQELGKWLVEHDRLEEKVPETLRPYLDYQSIGIDHCNKHDGAFLTDGYTGLRTGATPPEPELGQMMM